MTHLALANLAYGQDAPLVDHHQHLFSPALATLMSPPPPEPPAKPIVAKDLIALLDAAGIRRAVVLSTAYIWTQAHRKVENDRERVRADNDWTSQQVALFPDRLIGFCGLHPLKDWALEELARCAKDPGLRNGLKLHFGNAAVDYSNREHVDRLRAVFRAANGYRMPIVVHIRASLRDKLPYGREAALVFLNELIPAAPDVPIQIAHLGGAGSYRESVVDQAMQVFVEAIERGDPRTKNLWFDISGVVTPGLIPGEAELAVKRIRQLGIQRMVNCSDGAVPGNSPKEAWTALRKLPLTDEEFRRVATNVAPYLR